MRRLKLTRLGVRAAREPMPGPTEYFPGDPCPNCGTRNIGVCRTVKTVATITRYLRCGGSGQESCGFLPENKLFEAIRVS